MAKWEIAKVEEAHTPPDSEPVANSITLKLRYKDRTVRYVLVAATMTTRMTEVEAKKAVVK
jgi:hypothetical protein